MSTITTINAADQITDSRTVINTNFTNLNSEKIETSVLDTDTALTADSDSKIATQKAVKAYVDAGGNVNASTTQRGIVEEATAAEVLAGTSAGATGARLFINPSTFPTLSLTSTIATGTSTKNVADATGTQVIAHGLGVTPTFISMKAEVHADPSISGASHGEWYTGGFYNSISHEFVEGSGSANADTYEVSNLYILKLVGTSTVSGMTRYQTATIAVDATNITITWTKTSTPTGTYSFAWLAKAYTITKS